MIIITEFHQSQNQIWKLSNSLNFLKNTKPSTSSNFINCWSIFEFLFDLNSSHHHLQLFVKIGRQGVWNRDCTRIHHQWQIVIMSTRSGIKQIWTHHSPSWSSCYICLKPKHTNSSNSSAAISRWVKIESHEMLNGYMRFKVHFT